jgi:hypothetical protein
MYNCDASDVYRDLNVLELYRESFLRFSPLSALAGCDLRISA